MQLADRLSRWVDISTLPLPASPRRLVVVGRTSAGKTTLLNRLTGTQGPTGLGGVTREVVEIPEGPVTWIDTPGIDGVDRALSTLDPLITGAHGLIWVVDGLQPVTRTEREVLDLLVPAGLPVAVVISRADLLHDDLPAVRERVRLQTASFAPEPLLAANLRSPVAPTGLRLSRLTPAETSTRLEALQALEPDLLAARPLDEPALAALVTLRGPVKAWLDERDARDLTVAEQLQSFHDELQHLVDTHVVRWTADRRLGPSSARLPALPPVPDPSWSTLDSVRLGAAGASATRRELRGVAASWVAEVEIRLADWRDTVPLDPDALATWERDLQAWSAELGQLGHQDHQG